MLCCSTAIAIATCTCESHSRLLKMSLGEYQLSSLAKPHKPGSSSLLRCLPSPQTPFVLGNSSYLPDNTDGHCTPLAQKCCILGRSCSASSPTISVPNEQKGIKAEGEVTPSLSEIDAGWLLNLLFTLSARHPPWDHQLSILFIISPSGKYYLYEDERKGHRHQWKVFLDLKILIKKCWKWFTVIHVTQKSKVGR